MAIPTEVIPGHDDRRRPKVIVCEADASLCDTCKSVSYCELRTRKLSCPHFDLCEAHSRDGTTAGGWCGKCGTRFTPEEYRNLIGG